MEKALITRTVSTIFFCLLFIGMTATISHASGFNEAMDNLVVQITAEVSGSDRKQLAVVDFTDLDGEVSDLGKFVAEEILNRLFKAEGIRLVERRLMKKVLDEMKLQKSGALDEKSAKKLGKLLGADAICIGTITELQRSVKINARLIDVEEGRVFAVASAEVDKKDLPNVWMPERPEKEQPRPKQSYKKGFNYLQNGGFQKRYDYWQRTIGDVTRGASQAEIISFSHSKSGKALYIRHKGEGNIQFHQKVTVPGPDLIFSASFQAASHEGMIMGFSGSGVAQIGLQYFDESGTKLGETVLVNYVKNPFADTPLIGVPRRAGDTYKTHYIEFAKGKFNQNYQINIRSEIENNLMGIDPESVQSIAVIFWCGASHHQAGSELWITDIALRAR